MSDAFNVSPLVQTIQADEASPQQFIDLNKNYADNEETAAWVNENLIPLLIYARAQRMELEEEWREIRRMALLVHDKNQSYMGRSNNYVPLWSKALDTLVTQLINGLFPSDEYMAVKSLGEDPEAGQFVQDYLLYEFEKQMNLRLALKPMARNYWEFGFGISKEWYAKELEGVGRRELRRRPNSNEQAAPDLFIAQDREGCRLSSRNPFYVHVWPLTADSIEEATLVFEDIDISLQTLAIQERTGRWLNTESVQHGGVDAQHEMAVQEMLLQQVGTTASPTSTPGPGKELAQSRTVSECWLNMPLPDSAYVGDEVPGYPIPVKVVVSNGIILEVRRNPLWHQRPPYYMVRARPEAGNFYTKGNGFYSRATQYLANDLANQLNDNGTYALNPMAFVNTALMAGPPAPMRPGGVWNVLDINAVKFDRPPVEQIQYGMSLFSMWSSMNQDSSGAPPIMQGTNAGKGARTATSSQILQANASQPMIDTVQDFEAGMFRPMMRNTWLLGQQYRTAPVMARIAGKDIKVLPSQLVGDFDFAWLASTQAANKSARASQLLQFLQAVLPVAQLLQQQGKTIDPTSILRRLWTDGLGQRRFEELIVPFTPPMQPGAEAGIPGQMPGTGGAPSGVGESAIPEATDPTAGEGEAFGEVREGADMLSAMQGEEMGG